MPVAAGSALGVVKLADGLKPCRLVPRYYHLGYALAVVHSPR